MPLALDFVGGFHSEQEIQWGNALGSRGGGGVTRGAVVVLHFLLLTGKRQKSPILGDHRCRDILTTSQQDKDEQKPTPGAHIFGKQTYLLPAP